MKTILTTLTAALIAFGATATDGQSNETVLKVNTEKSTIFWTGKKLTGQHTGTLMFSEGNVYVADGVPTKIETNLDMHSIKVSDIDDAESNAKLAGHLNSPDFFSTEAYPTGTFQSTSLLPIEGATGRDANYIVKGSLTLKGITQEIEFPAFISAKNGKLVANGKITIDRSKWDIRYGSDSFFDDLGNKAIYDDIELNFVFMAES